MGFLRSYYVLTYMYMYNIHVHVNRVCRLQSETNNNVTYVVVSDNRSVIMSQTGNVNLTTFTDVPWKS